MLVGRTSGIFFNGAFETAGADAFDARTGLDMTGFLTGGASTGLAFAAGLPALNGEPDFFEGVAPALEAAPDDFADLAGATDFFATDRPTELLTAVFTEVFCTRVGAFGEAFAAAFTTVFAGAFTGFFAAAWLGALAGALDFLTGAFTIGLLWKPGPDLHPESSLPDALALAGLAWFQPARCGPNGLTAGLSRAGLAKKGRPDCGCCCFYVKA